jgi:hypothetical protein
VLVGDDAKVEELVHYRISLQGRLGRPIKRKNMGSLSKCDDLAWLDVDARKRLCLMKLNP